MRNLSTQKLEFVSKSDSGVLYLGMAKEINWPTVIYYKPRSKKDFYFLAVHGNTQSYSGVKINKLL